MKKPSSLASATLDIPRLDKVSSLPGHPIKAQMRISAQSALTPLCTLWSAHRHSVHCTARLSRVPNHHASGASAPVISPILASTRKGPGPGPPARRPGLRGPLLALGHGKSQCQLQVLLRLHVSWHSETCLTCMLLAVMAQPNMPGLSAALRASVTD